MVKPNTTINAPISMNACIQNDINYDMVQKTYDMYCIKWILSMFKAIYTLKFCVNTNSSASRKQKI